MPCYHVCRVLAFSTAVSLLPPPPLWLLASRIKAARYPDPFFFSSTCHLAMNLSAVSKIPRYHLPAFFAETVRRRQTKPHFSFSYSYSYFCGRVIRTPYHIIWLLPPDVGWMVICFAASCCLSVVPCFPFFSFRPVPLFCPSFSQLCSPFCSFQGFSRVMA